MKFNAHPIPFSDESLRGYHWRFALKNNFCSPRSMLKIITRIQNKPIAIDQLIQQHLSDENFQVLAAKQDRCDVAYVLKSHYRYCPECIAESNYLREAWDYALMPYCPNHGLLLKAENRDPSILLKVGRQGYSIEERQEPNDVLMSLQGLLAEKLGFEKSKDLRFSSLFHLNANQLQKLVVLVGSYYQRNGSIKPRKRPIKGDIRLAGLLVRGAAEVLVDFPKNIDLLIKRLLSDAPTSRRVRSSIGYLYAAVHRELDDINYRFFMDAFDEALAWQWPEVIDMKNPRLYKMIQDNPPYISGTEVRKNLGVSLDTLESLVDSGDIDGCVRKLMSGQRQISLKSGQEAMILHHTSSISLKEACRVLGLPKSCIRQLILSGVIEAKPPVAGSAWQLKPEDVQAFYERMLILGRTDFSTSDDKSLNQVARFYLPKGRQLAEVIQALLSGEMACRYHSLQSSRLLDLLHISLTDLNNWLKVSGELGIPDMAEALGVKQEVAYNLINTGIIPAVDRGRLGKRVRSKDIQDFQKKYVWARTLSRQVRTSPRNLVKCLSTLPVTPLSGPSVDGSRQYLYCWKDIFQSFSSYLDF